MEPNVTHERYLNASSVNLIPKWLYSINIPESGAFVRPKRYLPGMETRCIHELAMGECGHCKEIPFGLNATVFRTTFGKAFHNWNDCEDLELGQKFAESKGGSSTEIFGITYSAGSQELYPCEWCCALYYTKGLNLEDCIVSQNSIEKLGKIVKDRYISKNLRRYQIYFPETNEIEITTSRYIKRFK